MNLKWTIPELNNVLFPAFEFKIQMPGIKNNDHG